ncbi:MAG: cobalamin biosynthesis protein CbiL [Desulfovibrionales bacterium]|nr:cobalamin biosynthesis protein CbiL [Desulfovibrionales bacterium]
MRALLVFFLTAIMVHSLALAHRVNIFAYVDGEEIVAECSYSKSKRVIRGTIQVLEADSGVMLLHGETDEQGMFRFRVPEQARQRGSDLRILLQAGEGHQNEWTVEAAEFMASPPTPVGSQALPVAPNPASQQGDVATLSTAGLTRAEVEEVVNAALDAKLAPIKRAVLERQEKGPGLQEILGGIGWIFGLVGVAAYFKGRPRV